MSYEYGSFLIESKTLTIFNRTNLPDLNKLEIDIEKHIKKAIKQLKGGIRKIKDGTNVMKKTGEEVEVERSQPIHAIILIPELHLIREKKIVGLKLIDEFVKETGAYLHLLDITELLRIIQAAEMISEKSLTVSKIMAFDCYLIERFKKCLKKGTLCIEVLLHFE